MTPSKPYDLTAAKLNGFDSYEALARWLVDEIHNAEDVRSHTELDLDYWHRIYEQQRTRLVNNRPKPDGADLTTPLGTQYVDSLHARAMQTIFGVEPIWTVEGWQGAAERAPFVEEFHQWAAEEERVQSYVDRAVGNSWIDAVGVLEVYEEYDYRPVRKKIWAAIETIPDALGQPRAVFGEDAKPKFVMQNGKYQEMPPPAPGALTQTGSAEIEIDSQEPIRIGPGYYVIDANDFLVLPGHACDKRDIWGYAKRYYRRFSYLKAEADKGRFDKDAVAKIDDSNERETTIDDTRRGITVARQDGHTAEKQLYEVAFLRDLDGEGERWWVATVHCGQYQLLRLKYDELGTQVGFGRFVRFVPFPRKNSIDGLSVIGHKLITILEEHTAIRNMRADLAALHASTPMKVLQGALYDPDETPIGPGTSIYVRDMNEVMPMEFPDLSAPLNVWEHGVLDGAERTMGVNDIATGISSQESRTLGERQMQVGYSEVRIALPIKRLQESMEELAQIRHIIWKRTIAHQGEMPVPQSVMMGVEARGIETSALTSLQTGTMSAELFDGTFKFKPRGSVETADNGKLRQDFVQMLQALATVSQVNPMVAATWQTPQAAQALNEQIVRLFRFPARQAILGTAGQMAGQTQGLLADPRIQALLMQGAQQQKQLGGGQQPQPAMGAPQAPPMGAMVQ